MKKIKTILIRGIFYLMALQILNVSIDMDYIANVKPEITSSGNYDDIDSFLELLIEKALGDNNYTSEQDDDSGNAQEKGLEKYGSSPICFEQLTKPQLAYSLTQQSSWTTGIDQANKVCKGYFNIVSPPPDMV